MEKPNPPLSTSVYAKVLAFSQPSVGFVVSQVKLDQMEAVEENILATLKGVEEGKFDVAGIRRIGMLA